MKMRFLCWFTLISFLITACQISPTTATPTSTVTTSSTALFLDPTQPVAARADDLLARLTLAEKIGQMTQVEKNSLTPEEVKHYLIGSVLSGGGGSPANNTAADWAAMTDGFQKQALQTRLAIPLIYGVDAAHGHGDLYGATIFPHNIGLGEA